MKTGSGDFKYTFSLDTSHLKMTHIMMESEEEYLGGAYGTSVFDARLYKYGKLPKKEEVATFTSTTETSTQAPPTTTPYQLFPWEKPCPGRGPARPP